MFVQVVKFVVRQGSAETSFTLGTRRPRESPGFNCSDRALTRVGLLAIRPSLDRLYCRIMRFENSITTLNELREVIPPPGKNVTAKEVDLFDSYCRDFISRSPFVLIASSDGRGSIDISPKGDPPGFVQVLDDRTLAIPDRPGNHRADTFVNVLQHPYVGLIFLIPGTKNTLRVRGRASIVRDHDLLSSMAINGRTPDLALVVELTTAYFHCAKCIIRSELWSGQNPTADPVSDELLLAETMVKHGELELTVGEMQEIIVNDEDERLY